MKKLCVALLFIGLFLVGCELKPESFFTINQSTYTMRLGESLELDITFTGDELYSIEVQDPTILSLTNNVRIEALAIGETTIIVEMGEQLETITVTVLPLPQYVIVGSNEVVAGSEAIYTLEVYSVLVEQVSWSIQESELATITGGGVLTPIAVGIITLNATVDEVVVASMMVTITPLSITSIEFTTDEYALVDETRTLEVLANGNPLTWSSSNLEVATVSEDGTIEFIGVGETTIRVEVTNNPSVYYEQVIRVRDSDNLSTERIIVDASIVDSTKNIFYYEEIDYHRNINVFSTIETAIAACGENSVVVLTPGTYSEDFTLNKSHMKLVGPNMDVDPTTKERVSEALITGKVRISSAISYLTLNGLAFTGGSTITLEGQTTLFTFVNNVVSNTTQTAAAWTDLGTYTGGFLYFRSGSKFSDEVVIENNRFSTLGDVAINFNQIDNFKVINNTFDGFTRDAIRVSNGIVSKSCQWLFRNNTFLNGSYNGLFFRTYGSNIATTENIISILDNSFESVGQTNVLFSGAISFKNYQEGLTSINISYNEFKTCTNYILLRNNALVANQPRFSAYITYNSFIGLPNSYYLRNKNASDTASTNPSTIQMTNNYYGLVGGSEVDVVAQQAKFMGTSCEVTTISETTFSQAPRVYGSNLVHLDTTPKMLAPEGATFSSSDESLFTVNLQGVITPLKVGVGTLTVLKGGVEVKFPIVVGASLNVDYIYLLLQAAYGEEGYKEGANNDTKYGTWYGIPNAAWCAMFVSWCSNQAGISTSIIPKYASVSLGMEWFQNKGLFQFKANYIPKAGDLIFFKSDGASHTGIVISCDGTTVYTIEGNTSDMVAKRSYPLMYSKITGYGLPEYPTFNGTPYVFDISGATDGDGHSTR